jgi:lipid II:glycine glycyltransferase (peptidoglycan interpeptide bridge formation enzyme)
MEIFFTKEEKWLKKWDEFISSNDQGSHLQLSDWLKSYNSYGFDFEVCICIENDQIIGGFGAVIAKVLFFKFYIIAYGPIVIQNYNLLNSLIIIASERAKAIDCCYCQINLPITINDLAQNHLQNNNNQLQVLNSFKSNHLFKFVFSLNGLNWLDLKNYDDSERLLLDFKSSVRRDIRSAIRKKLELRILHFEIDIETAYNLCLDNAKRGKYAIRDWSGFREALLNLSKKGNAKFLATYKDNEMKGAILLVKAGNFYTYILGGTIKEKPDLLVGHFLQWEAIKLSIFEKCDGYNISLGGSEGVQEFKKSFNNEPIFFENGKFHKVINPFLFNIFLFFEKYMKPYKNGISKILSKLKSK